MDEQNFKFNYVFQGQDCTLSTGVYKITIQNQNQDNNIKLIEIRYDEDVWEVLTRELLDNQTTNEECK